MKKWYFAANVGFYAGLIWGLIGWIMFFLNFTKVLPAFLVEPFFKKSFMHSWSGHLVGLASFIGFSIVAALLYAACLLKRKGPWPGIFYGVVWWGFLFAVLGPIAGMLPPFRDLSINSLVSEACRFVLWGVFIGYSIALEFTDERQREPVPEGN